MTVFDKAKEKKSVAADSRKNARLSWPPLRGGSARRRWGREPCGGQEYFGSRLAKNACSSPLKLKLHLFRQVCRGRIYASRAVYPLYRMIGTAAAGGIYAAPTSQPILFILVYGRGRGMPRPYIPYMTKQMLFFSPALPLHILKMRSPFFLFFSRNSLAIPFSLPCSTTNLL